MSSLNLKLTWLTDDTVRIQTLTYDFDEALFEPTTHVVKIYDPTGSLRGSIVPPNIGTTGTGTYYYDYVIPSDAPAGVWKTSWKVLSGTYPAREIIHFKVAEG